ncbi:BrnT family toxin [Candidatus Poribacteria bacterium]|nr:BrnT family toxin [Candidatus Poribacteria bacterium]
MRVVDFIWKENIAAKLESKHNVTTEEVEEVFRNRPRFRRVETGKVEGENVYSAMGPTNAGRYLIVYFIMKLSKEALVISARDMNRKEAQTVCQDVRNNGMQFPNHSAALRKLVNSGIPIAWQTIGSRLVKSKSKSL